MSSQMSGITNIDTSIYVPISNCNRGHKVIQLANGVTALIISDASESFASVCVSVTTGSHNDPDDVPGLAHLCEHMLINSESKHFPSKTHYHDLLTEYNGNQNAYTTGEQTSFYFELPNSNNRSGRPIFDELVEVLADKLKSPVFHSDSISKEIYAIDNEHENNKNITSKVFYHGMRKLANPASQFSRFCTGNVYTLAQLPVSGKFSLKSLLQAYHSENFVAENISIVIRGCQSLQYLSKLVQSNFGGFHDVVGSGLKPFQKLQQIWTPKYREPLFKVSVPGSSAPNAVFIQSTKALLVRLVFPISLTSSSFSRNELKLFSKVWCDLFGDEGRGSMYSHFSSRHDVEKLVTSISEFTVNDKALVLQFELAASGWKYSVNSILKDLFHEFIPYLVTLDTDTLARYLNEWNATNLLQFLYQDLDNSIMDRCADLCSKVMDCDNPSFLLNGGLSFACNHWQSNIGSYYENAESRQWWNSQAQRFQTFLSRCMAWDNCKLLIHGDLNCNELFLGEHSVSSLKQDVHYKFDFKLDSISLPGKPEVKAGRFQLPDCSKFLLHLERNLTALKQSLRATSIRSEESSLSIITQSDLLETSPRLMSKNDNYELWIKEESSLEYSSRSLVTVELINMNLHDSAENTMHLEILTQLLYLYINEELYPVERIGYMYQIAANNRGDVRLSITINGFPQGVVKILRIIMNKMIEISDSTFDISNKLFRKSRVIVRNKYKEAAKANSCTLASLGVVILLEKSLSTLEERLDALESIDLDNFRYFCEQLWIPRSNYMNLLIHGDASIADSVNEYMNTIISHLGENGSKHLSTAIQSFRLKEPETVRLPEGSNLYIELPSFEEDPTNSVVYFLETGDRKSSKDYALASLMEFFMSMTLIPDLRNKKQIGYVVLGGLRLLTDTLGIHISVMSNLKPEKIEGKIEEYLSSCLEFEILEQMTEQEFQDKVLDKYLQLIKSNSLEKLTKNAGPANLLSQIEASVHSGNYPSDPRSQAYTLSQHKKLRDEISFRTYTFNDVKVDVSFVSKLTLAQFKRFFSEKISTSSSLRRKLSVAFRTAMVPTDLTITATTMQLEGFLKSKGLYIARDDLQEIVKKSQGNASTTLFKDLFRHFRSQGQSLRLCTLIFKEICKQSFSHRVSGDSSTTFTSRTKPAVTIPRIQQTRIKSVSHFKLSL